MDDKNQSPSTPRRKAGRFKPRAGSKKPKSTASSIGDNDAEREAMALLRKAQDGLRKRVPKAEKNSSVKVAFGPGAPSSSSIRTYGVSKIESRDQDLGMQSFDDDDGDQIMSTLATGGAGTSASMDIDVMDSSILNAKKNYREIWDYNSNYPISLPLRKPYSGDPEILDETEFGKNAEKEYDESTLNDASELGLLEENAKDQLLFVQLPHVLPLGKQSASAVKGKGKVGKAMSSEMKGGNLEDLPKGYMGKMLVYKSGAVKLKLGDVLYDVSPGLNCVCPQSVSAINTKNKTCCVLGDVAKQAVVTPDVDALLDGTIKLDQPRATFT